MKELEAHAVTVPEAAVSHQITVLGISQDRMADGGQMSPDLMLPEGQTEAQGIWAIRRRNFLKEECRPVYYSLMTSGRLAEHLAKTQREAEEMMEMLCRQIAEREHVTEELKEADPMKWTALMNSIRASAEEIVKRELIQI